MAYGSMTMEERLKEHIKEYSLENLLDLSLVKACFEDISKVLGIELLLTQRHGETAVEVGNFAGFEPDVVNDPGRKASRIQSDDWSSLCKNGSGFRSGACRAHC